MQCLRMRVGEHPSDFVFRARKIVSALRQLGEPYSDLALCTHVLQGLTSDYHQQKMVQEALIQHDDSVNKLETTLCRAYVRMSAKRSSPPVTQPKETPLSYRHRTTAHLAATPPASRGTSPGPGNRAPVPAVQVRNRGSNDFVCHFCGERGHFMKDCPKYVPKVLDLGKSRLGD
jgi:hypothetical protein